MSAQKIIEDLLKSAGIEINGPNPWDIQIHNHDFYKRVLNQTELGFGESYMEGWWDCDAIDELINKILRAKLDLQLKKNFSNLLYITFSKIVNRQTYSRSQKVAQEHYDLGNDLYRLMLDERLNYTCAYWKNTGNLNQAQEAKLELVCQKINVQPGMRILELGCGWGAFAKYAAERYGASVVAYNISREQVSLARELCRGLPVDIRLQDFRKAEGKYDAVVSIGIMEHVGYKNYRHYMELADKCLEKDGISFIHTIGNNKSASHANRWTNKYIFPNGMLPSIAQLAKAMEGIFVLEDLHNIGPDYDKTLMAWYQNFEAAWPQLKKKYSNRFYRMWRYYLLSSAGGFRARTSQLWQFVMTKPGRNQPDCRIADEKLERILHSREIYI